MEKSTLVGAAAGFAGALVIGTIAVANAGTTPTPAPTTQTAPSQPSQPSQPEPQRHGRHEHTPASAAETSAVRAAVAKKDAAVTVDEVVKDADGSFDVRGTKAGAPVRVEVSKDCATVTVQQGGPGGHRGGRWGTPVDAATLAKIQAAVTAKDSAVTIRMAVKAPDGSYRAMGTKASERVMARVSADLSTVQIRTGGPGHDGMRGRGGHGRPDHDGPDGPQSPTVTPSSSASGATTTSYSA